MPPHHHGVAPFKGRDAGEKEFERVKGKEGEGRGMVEWKGGGMREINQCQSQSLFKRGTLHYQLPTTNVYLVVN